MSKSRLLRGIARNTSITSLEKLKNTGLQQLADSNISDITESDIAELTAIVDARIIELTALA